MESSNALTLSEVIAHFEAWRSTRVGKSRIPAHLWQGINGVRGNQWGQSKLILATLLIAQPY